MDAPSCDFPELAADEKAGEAQREEDDYKGDAMQHGVNGVWWFSEGIREKQGGHDKSQARDYEQGGTSTPKDRLDPRPPLEETDRENDEQETKNDEIRDLYPAARIEEKVTDRLSYGRIPRPECAIKRENQDSEDGANDACPDAEAPDQTPCSACGGS